MRVVAKRGQKPDDPALSLEISGVSEPVRTPCSAGDRITVAHDVPSNTISFRCKRGEVHRLVALGPNQDAYVHCMKDGGRGEAAAFAGVGPIWGEAKVLYGCQPGHRRGVVQFMKSRGPDELRKFLGAVWDERQPQGDEDPWMEAAATLPTGEFEELQRTGCASPLGAACRVAEPSRGKVPLPFLRRLSLCPKRADDVAPCAALVERMVQGSDASALPELLGDLLLLTAETEQATRAACKILEAKSTGPAGRSAVQAGAWAVVAKRGLSCGTLPPACGQGFDHPTEHRLYTDAEVTAAVSPWFGAAASKPEPTYGRVLRSKANGGLVGPQYELAVLYASYRRGATPATLRAGCAPTP